jgi:hypothetical protein
MTVPRRRFVPRDDVVAAFATSPVLDASFRDELADDGETREAWGEAGSVSGAFGPSRWSWGVARSGPAGGGARGSGVSDGSMGWGSAGPGVQPAPPSKRPTVGAVGCLGFVLGAITVVLALFTLLVFASPGPDRPECDGEPMSRGDECITLGGSESGTDTYEEKLEEIRDSERTQERLRLPMLIATIVCLVGAVVLVVAGVRRKRALAAAP